jgi:DNA-binding transcriptional LysR family regulator
VNVRDLLDIKVICESGSLRKAALVLGVTQPTLSNRIAHLEDQLGSRLFDRSRGHSRPTDLALFIAGRSDTISVEASRLVHDIRRVASGQRGIVRIGVGPIPVRILLARVALAISARYPDISIEFVSSSTHQLLQWLVSREVDVVICAPVVNGHTEINAEPLLETDIVAVAHPDHPMIASPPTNIAGLFKYPIATLLVEPPYPQVLREEHGIDLEAQVGRVMCPDIGMLVQVVSNSSRFFTAGPRFAFAKEIAAGSLAVIGIPLPFRHLIQMHTSIHAYPLPAVTRIQAIIRETFGETRAAHG